MTYDQTICGQFPKMYLLRFEKQVKLPGLCYAKVSTTLSLDLCPDFMGSVVGQASFLIHISQQLLPILEGISVTK